MGWEGGVLVVLQHPPVLVYRRTSKHGNTQLRRTQGLSGHIHDLISQLEKSDRFDWLGEKVG